jgi:transposase
MLLNAVRGLVGEFDIIAAQGPARAMHLIAELHADGVCRAAGCRRSAVLCLARQLQALAEQIRVLDRRLLAWHRQDQASQRLAGIPGVGILTATALSASVPDPSVFRSGRQFAAFLGLVPRQSSSGGKERLGRISKMGDRYLRKLLVVGATSVLRRAGRNPSLTGPG